MRLPRRLAAIGLFNALLLQPGCWDNPEQGQHQVIQQDAGAPLLGRLEIDPTSLDFGPVCAGTSATRTATLRNTGDGQLTLKEVVFSDEESEVIRLSEEIVGAQIAAGSSLQISVEFSPIESGDTNRSITITPESKLVAAASIELTGYEGGPELQLDAETADFGPVAVYERAEHVTRISSVGEKPLTIMKVSLVSTMEPDELWISDLSATTFPVSLSPGDHIDVTLAMRPSAYEPFSETPLGQLEVQSSDCADSNTEVPILGWPGGVASDCVPLMEEGHLGKEIADVDVLFVVDNSASMAEEQAALAEHFAEFVSYADGLGIDYLIGVTTTDVEGDAGTLQGEPTLITPGLTDAFLANVQVGTSGSDSEKGLEASVLALEGDGDQTLGGHLRSDANLAVIYVSDDDDHSTLSTQEVFSSLSSVKALHPGDFEAHALVAMPPGCAEETENYGLRYMEVAAATSGSSTSICDSDFEAAFSEIGIACFGDAATFHLEKAAKPETVEVLVDGAPCDGSWAMSEDVSSVVFDFDSACFPTPGMAVVIRYVPLCWPEDVPMEWLD
jgi:hypothetical protein